MRVLMKAFGPVPGVDECRCHLVVLGTFFVTDEQSVSRPIFNMQPVTSRKNRKTPETAIITFIHTFSLWRRRKNEQTDKSVRIALCSLKWGKTEEAFVVSTFGRTTTGYQTTKCKLMCDCGSMPWHFCFSVSALQPVPSDETLFYSVLHRCGDTQFHFKFSFRSYLNDAGLYLRLRKIQFFPNVFVASLACIGYREQCLHVHLFSCIINKFKLKINLKVHADIC